MKIGIRAAGHSGWNGHRPRKATLEAVEELFVWENMKKM